MCLAQEISNDRYIYCFQGALSLGEKTDIFAINITEWKIIEEIKEMAVAEQRKKERIVLGEGKPEKTS